MDNSCGDDPNATVTAYVFDIDECVPAEFRHFGEGKVELALRDSRGSHPYIRLRMTPNHARFLSHVLGHVKEKETASA